MMSGKMMNVGRCPTISGLALENLTFVVLLKHGIQRASDERGDAGPARAKTCSVANLDDHHI